MPSEDFAFTDEHKTLLPHLARNKRQDTKPRPKQSELAKLYGLETQSQWSKAESGKSQSIRDLTALASYLGCTTQDELEELTRRSQCEDSAIVEVLNYCENSHCFSQRFFSYGLIVICRPRFVRVPSGGKTYSCDVCPNDLIPNCCECNREVRASFRCWCGRAYVNVDDYFTGKDEQEIEMECRKLNARNEASMLFEYVDLH